MSSSFADLSEQSPSASSPTTFLRSHSAKSPLLKKNINKVFQGKVDEDHLKHSSSVVNSQIADSLGQLLEDLNMADDGNPIRKASDDEETEDYTVQTEIEEMSAMGLPITFGKQNESSRKIVNR